MAKRMSEKEKKAHDKEAKRKAREALLEAEENETEEEEEFDDLESETLSLLGAHEESADELSQENAFDIFDYIQNEYSNKGVMVVYTITKDGHRMTDEYHPCSWSKLQKKYGGGHYSVTAKTGNNKTYIKQQTQLVGDLYQPMDEKKEEKSPLPQSPQSPAVDVTGMMQAMMNMFQEMQRMNQDEKSRRERDERRTEEKGNAIFFQVMSEQQKTTQDLFMRLSEQNMKTSQALSENFAKVLEKMDDKNQRTFEKLTEALKQKQEFGLKDILALQKQSEDAGWEKMKMVLELAEERSGKGDEGGDSSGMMGKLITGILPLLAGAGQQQQMALLQQQQMQQQRRALPQQTQTPRNERGVGSATAQKTPNQGPKRSTHASQVNPVSQSSGLPTRAKKESVKEEVIVYDEPEKLIPMKRGAEELFSQASELQRAVAQTAIPVIVEFLQVAGEPGLAAKKTLDLLKSQRVDVGLALKEFSKEFILEIAGAFQMPEKARPWLEEYYAYLENSARMDSQGAGEPASSGESQTV